MASLVPQEVSAVHRALVKKGEGESQGVSIVASGLCVPTLLVHSHVPTLTQKQVEDPGSHPAGAER
jgi:hypothetical protein